MKQDFVVCIRCFPQRRSASFYSKTWNSQVSFETPSLVWSEAFLYCHQHQAAAEPTSLISGFWTVLLVTLHSEVLHKLNMGAVHCPSHLGRSYHLLVPTNLFPFSKGWVGSSGILDLGRSSQLGGISVSSNIFASTNISLVFFHLRISAFHSTKLGSFSLETSLYPMLSYPILEGFGP